MNCKIFSLLFISIFLLSAISATSVVDGYFQDDIYSTAATINSGESINLNAIFSSTGSITSKTVNVPSGLSIAEDSCDLSVSGHTYSCAYTITANSAGTYEIEIIGTDNSGSTDSSSLTLTVNHCPIPPTNHAPEITSSPVTQIDEGQHYSYHVVATDEDGDTLTYSLTQKPSWLSINSATGIISGTAPFVNSDTNYNVGVKVSDEEKFDTQDYALTVKNIPCPPANHAPEAQNQNVITNQNTPKTITLSATDIDGNALTYSIVNTPSHGVLSGFSSSTGQVTYMPNSGFSGSDSFTFRANDGIVNSNTATISITVNSQPPTNHAPVITSSPVIIVDEGQHYSYDVNAVDSDGDTLTYSLTQKPSWLSINSATGLISGTAPLVSSNTNYNVGVKVSDGKGGIDTQSYILTVKNILCPENPEMDVISPENKEYTTDHVNLRVETNDVVEGVKFKLDYGTYVEMDNPYDNVFTDSIHVSDGEHFITFYPTDDGGNIIGSGKTVHFSVDTSEHEEDKEINGTSSVRILADDSYYLNKYYDQFSTGNIVSETTTPSTSSSNVSIVPILVYTIIGIIVLGIIFVLFILFNYLRR